MNEIYLSDFVLFLIVKMLLKGCYFNGVNTRTSTLKAIPSFKSVLERCLRCIDSPNFNYFCFIVVFMVLACCEIKFNVLSKPALLHIGLILFCVYFENQDKWQIQKSLSFTDIVDLKVFIIIQIIYHN